MRKSTSNDSNILEKKTLNKTQRLKSRKAIKSLFTEGKKIRTDRLLLFYTTNEDLAHNQFMFSVSKKIFKSAVKRNRIKRLLKESLRLQQYDILNQTGPYFHLAFIYLHKELADQETIHQEIGQLLSKLNGKINQTSE